LSVAAAIALLQLLAGCSLAPVSARPPPAAVADLAPTGKLRAAINTGNPILARKDASSGELTGVSVDLSRELAKRLGVPLEPYGVDTAAKSVAAIKSGTCDVAFVAIDPARAVDMDYGAVRYEGAYLVAQASPIRSNAEVDREGCGWLSRRRRAESLSLARVGQAQIVRAPSSPAVVDMMLRAPLDMRPASSSSSKPTRSACPACACSRAFHGDPSGDGTPRGRPASALYLAGSWGDEGFRLRRGAFNATASKGLPSCAATSDHLARPRRRPTPSIRRESLVQPLPEAGTWPASAWTC
jgi:polar amino acid transport system substrate-binding protein